MALGDAIGSLESSKVELEVLEELMLLEGSGAIMKGCVIFQVKGQELVRGECSCMALVELLAWWV